MNTGKPYTATLLSLLFMVCGFRHVTLVGDSLITCAHDKIVCAINNNGEQSHVFTEHVWNGSAAYNNPINHEIYSLGVAAAFGKPDVVVFSFGTNEMGMVASGKFTYESALQSMQTLINQAVAAGATCIVLLEASHRLRGDHAIGASFEQYMNRWFDHWHLAIGDNEFLGLHYQLAIADISQQLHTDPAKYMADAIHLSDAGGKLAASAIVKQINSCPEGRWIYGKDEMKPGASFPPPPYREYLDAGHPDPWQ